MRRATLLLAALGLLATPALADEGKKPSCFLSSEFDNWKAPDNKTIYIKVRPHRYYRLDLAASCPELRWPSAFLITKIHGSNMICTPLDWDLHVAQSWHDIPQGCIVKSMTELTPDEVAAIDPKNKP